MSLDVSVQHHFDDFALNVSFEAPAGITVLFGRSGSGKTSVVNAVAGLLAPAAGRVAIDGTVLLDTARGIDIARHKRRIGYVFQDARLFPHLSVRQNLTFGQRFAPKDATAASFEKVVQLLGIEDFLARRPGALSGGEKQRVAIGRALLSAPRLLLMDEPLAALDDARKAEIIPYLERLRDETRVPILYVSHAVSEVARLATTLVVLEQGKVMRSGPATQILADPASVPVLGTRAAGAVIAGRLVRHDPDGLSVLEFGVGELILPRIGASVGDVVRVRIEASDIILARDRPVGISALNILPVTVTTIQPGAGPGAAVGLRAGNDLLLARVTRRSVAALGLAPGVACFAIVKSTSVAQGDVGS
ncbi:MAG: molybdate transport system ATP-binding protein [Paracoccaceae bacterium]|jgi:molybdate transport system ATP-binding protein